MTEDKNSRSRKKRDVTLATKYIETALVIDKAMFDKRNGSTRADIVHDVIQVIEIFQVVNLCLKKFTSTT